MGWMSSFITLCIISTGICYRLIKLGLDRIKKSNEVYLDSHVVLPNWMIKVFNIENEYISKVAYLELWIGIISIFWIPIYLLVFIFIDESFNTYLILFFSFCIYFLISMIILEIISRKEKKNLVNNKENMMKTEIDERMIYEYENQQLEIFKIKYEAKLDSIIASKGYYYRFEIYRDFKNGNKPGKGYSSMICVDIYKIGDKESDGVFDIIFHVLIQNIKYNIFTKKYSVIKNDNYDDFEYMLECKKNDEDYK